MKLALHALAIALATIVLPQPGGPYNNTPAVFLSPNFSHNSGYLNGFKISFSSWFFTSAKAPISSNDIKGIWLNPSLLIIGLVTNKAWSKCY